MPNAVSLLLVGVGSIGRRHAEAIRAVEGAHLQAIVDPGAAGRAAAMELGVPCFDALEPALAAGRPDGVLLATPNALHVSQGLTCVTAGLPLLVEKPVATDVASGKTLVTAAERSGLPLLVGHHRRHNSLLQAARAQVEAGRLGTLVTVQATCWAFKPDDYFEMPWRREPGAGPVLINLIHDIDCLRYLCGEIRAVQALESNLVRGFSVEDSAVILLHFENGAVGTVSVSDTVVGPWSWERTARENPAYPPTDAVCYMLGGTHGALELPAGRLWHHTGVRSWREPLHTETLAVTARDPLHAQIRHFCRVIRGEEAPLVSGREGLRTLAVIEAAKRAAATGTLVPVEAL